jgi:hypothetical protein
MGRVIYILVTFVAMYQYVVCRAQEPFSNEFPAQYHIQTDQGPSRFFRFQTSSGQFRKERRNPDGSVVGSYGWIDPNGILSQTKTSADTFYGLCPSAVRIPVEVYTPKLVKKLARKRTTKPSRK